MGLGVGGLEVSEGIGVLSFGGPVKNEPEFLCAHRAGGLLLSLIFRHCQNPEKATCQNSGKSSLNGEWGLLSQSRLHR